MNIMRETQSTVRDVRPSVFYMEFDNIHTNTQAYVMICRIVKTFLFIINNNRKWL